MNKYYVFVLAILLATFNGFSQEKAEEFKPSGKPFMKIYTNYHSTFSDGETTKAFELTRFYLGYEYNFSKNLSAKANIDVGDPAAGKHQMAAFVKNAYLKYKTGNLTVNFGLIATTQFKVQEDFWGLRYVAKVFQDEYKFASSADLGVSASYKFADWINADFSIFNGEGYKSLETDNIFRNAIGVSLLPVDGLTLRGFYDWMGNDVYQQSMVGFVGYKTNIFSIAAEYNYQKNQNMTEGRDWYGPSFYASCTPAKKLKIYARFDDLSSSKETSASQPWNLAKDGQLLMIGLDYSAVKGVNFSPNFQGWNPANNTLPYKASVYLNCEIKF